MQTTPSPRSEHLLAPPIAVRQGGAFTRRQAADAGWSPAQVKHRLRSGAWRRLAGQGLVVRDSEVNGLTRVWAVHLTWPDAVASHLTAALYYRMPLPPPGVQHAITPCSRTRLSDLRSHLLALDDADVRRLGPGGPRLTTPRRTALDCLRTVDVEAAERLFAWCATREVLTRAQLAAAVRDTFAAWGTPQLLTLLRRTQGGALSAAERRLHGALRRGGLRHWSANATVSDPDGIVAVVDVLFADLRLVVEVDGWSAHGHHDAFVADRRRQNRLVAAGYTVLRFTWDDLVHREAEVLAEIMAMHDQLSRPRAVGVALGRDNR